MHTELGLVRSLCEPPWPFYHTHAFAFVVWSLPTPPHLMRAGEGAPRPARWQVEDTLEKTQLHEDLLEAGLLNIVNAWLRPLADGSIPNVSVRTTLLRLLTKLPVNVEMFDRREQLKKSGLGKVKAPALCLVSASFRVLGG